MSRRPSLAIAVLCALIAGVLLAPSPASAARGAEVSIMDDQLVLRGSQRHVDRQMRLFRRLGIDRLRVSAFWTGSTFGSQNSSTKPSGFNTTNPFDPHYSFGTLDRAVHSARRHGLQVMLTITTPAPRWATSGGERLSPRPAEFASYAEAVARRYAGLVDHYGLANEPNQPGWLRPQTDSRGLVSPHLYRQLLQASYPRIKAADPSSVVLAGNLASSGVDRPSPSKGIRPLAFLRSMACVDRSLRPVTTGRCAGFRPVPADAFGHHPYKFFGSPRARSRKRDDAAIGDGRRLLRTLDRLQARGRIVKSTGGGRFSVFYTEFGYQTDPPDPFAGISLRSHNRFLQDAAYLVWRTPRLRAYNQFRLTDGPLRRARGLRRYAEFQSGILFANRRKKPAYRSFADPFVIDGSRFWGQVRPGGRHTVRLQFRRRGGRFRTIKRARTDSAGYFRVRAKRRRGQYRFTYRGPSGASDTLTIR